MPTRMSPRLKSHVDRWETCTRCPLGEAATEHVIFRGDVPCEILFIGEAPGEDEDASGLPFVGRAGKCFQKIVDRTFEERRKDQGWHLCCKQHRKDLKTFPPFTYAVTNTLCCRPPKNRDPLPEEMEACRPRLQEFVNLCSPQVIVLLGKVSQKNSPRSYTYYRDGLVTVEPKILEWYHPSYLLRKGRSFEEEKRAAYTLELLQEVRNLVPF